MSLMGVQFPGRSATTHDEPHHALPGRVAASESSSTCHDTKTNKNKNPMKKPSKKKHGDNEEDDDEPVPSEHEPLGGTDDDDNQDDNASGGEGDGVPKDLKPKNVMKKPGGRATGTMKRPSKRTKKHEDWFYVSFSRIIWESVVDTSYMFSIPVCGYGCMQCMCVCMYLYVCREDADQVSPSGGLFDGEIKACLDSESMMFLGEIQI